MILIKCKNNNKRLNKKQITKRNLFSLQLKIKLKTIAPWILNMAILTSSNTQE